MKFLKILFSLSYFTFLIYAVFLAGRRKHQNLRLAIFVPLNNIIKELRVLNFNENGDLINYFSNLLGNIVLFVPYTFILIVLYGIRNNRLILASAFLLSTGIEFIQYCFRLGVADINDILLNTLGALAGILFFKHFRKTIPEEPSPRI